MVLCCEIRSTCNEFLLKWHYINLRLQIYNIPVLQSLLWFACHSLMLTFRTNSIVLDDQTVSPAIGQMKASLWLSQLLAWNCGIDCVLLCCAWGLAFYRFLIICSLTRMLSIGSVLSAFCVQLLGSVEFQIYSCLALYAWCASMVLLVSQCFKYRIFIWVWRCHLGTASATCRSSVAPPQVFRISWPPKSLFCISRWNCSLFVRFSDTNCAFSVVGETHE